MCNPTGLDRTDLPTRTCVQPWRPNACNAEHSLEQQHSDDLLKRPHETVRVGRRQAVRDSKDPNLSNSNGITRSRWRIPPWGQRKNSLSQKLWVSKHSLGRFNFVLAAVKPAKRAELSVIAGALTVTTGRPLRGSP